MTNKEIKERYGKALEDMTTAEIIAHGLDEIWMKQAEEAAEDE